MILEEKGLAISKLINDALRADVASCEISYMKGGGLHLKLKQHEYHDWKNHGIHMANIFEQIFRKFGMVWYAYSVYDDSVSISLYESDKLIDCNREGIPWKDVPTKAECPKCHNKKHFDLMTYDPEDARGMTCPECGYQGHVPDFWRAIKK